MKKTVVALVALLAIYVGVGMFAAQYYFERSLKRLSTEVFGSELQVRKILMNPLNFTAQLEDVALADESGEITFTASRVLASTGFWDYWSRTGKLSSLTFFDPKLIVADNEPGKQRAMKILWSLFEATEKLPEQTEISSLNLVQATVVMVDRTRSPSQNRLFPKFKLSTDSLGASRTGTFQISGNPGDGPGFMMKGSLAWAKDAANGQFELGGLDMRHLGFLSGRPDVLRQVSVAAGIKSEFKAEFSERGLQLELERAEFKADAFETDSEQLLRVTGDSLQLDFNVSLNANFQVVQFLGATAKTGAFRILGPETGGVSNFQIPVKTAELNLSGFTFPSTTFDGDKPGDFDLLLRTEPAGAIQLSGNYLVSGGKGSAALHLLEIPLTSLFLTTQKLLPESIINQSLSADGSVRLHPSTASFNPASGIDKPELTRGLVRAIVDLGAEPLATLSLAGELSSGGQLDLFGLTQSANPLFHSRVQIGLNQLDAAWASPVTRDFADRAIVSGFLDSKLALHIDDNRFAARHDVVLRDLLLENASGETAFAEDPLDLAVALLQDEDHRIDLSFSLAAPIDEYFDLPSMMSDAVSGYLDGITAKPVEAMATMLGTDAEALETVGFRPGEAGLNPESLGQLEWLKTALQWRPGLSLEVAGAYDPEADRYALAYQQVRLHVLLATAADPAFRSNSAPIVFADPKVQIVLDEFAGSRLGKAAVAAIAENFAPADDTGQQDLSASDKEPFYRALFAALVANEKIGERALASLARYRAQAVVDQLVRGDIERERLSTGELQTEAATILRGIPVRMTLGVSAQKPEPGKKPVSTGEGSEPVANDPIPIRHP